MQEMVMLEVYDDQDIQGNLLLVGTTDEHHQILLYQTSDAIEMERVEDFCIIMFGLAIVEDEEVENEVEEVRGGNNCISFLEYLEKLREK